MAIHLIQGDPLAGSLTPPGSSGQILWNNGGVVDATGSALTFNSGTSTTTATNVTVATNLTLSNLAANRVMYSNGSKVASTSGNLTFDGTTLGANALAVTNDATVSGKLAVGTTVTSTRRVSIQHSVSTDTDALALAATLFIQGPSSTGAGSFPKAGQFFTWLDAGANTIQYSTGFFASTRTNNQTGTVSEQYGCDFDVWKDGSHNVSVFAAARSFMNVVSGSTGTITEANGYRVSFNTGGTCANVTYLRMFDLLWDFSGTNSMTEAVGLNIRAPSGSGSSPTTMYGIRVADITKGSTNYALYFEGTSGLARQGVWWNGDTNLYRSALGTLRTDGALVAGGSLSVGSTATVTTSITCPAYQSSAAMTVRPSASAGTGFNLTVQSGTVTALSAAAGGDLLLIGSPAGGTVGNANGGSVKINAGLKKNSGTTGSILLYKSDGSTKVVEVNDTGLGLFAATPVAQQSGTGETTGFTAGAGTNVTDASTFTGNVGSTAYRISDIVKALKNYGLLAQ